MGQVRGPEARQRDPLPNRVVHRTGNVAEPRDPFAPPREWHCHLPQARSSPPGSRPLQEQRGQRPVGSTGAPCPLRSAEARGSASAGQWRPGPSSGPSTEAGKTGPAHRPRPRSLPAGQPARPDAPRPRRYVSELAGDIGEHMTRRLATTPVQAAGVDRLLVPQRGPPDDGAPASREDRGAGKDMASPVGHRSAWPRQRRGRVGFDALSDRCMPCRAVHRRRPSRTADEAPPPTAPRPAAPA